MVLTAGHGSLGSITSALSFDSLTILGNHTPHTSHTFSALSQSRKHIKIWSLGSTVQSSGFRLPTRFLEKGIQAPMAQGRSNIIISMSKWIRTSRLLLKNSLSLKFRVQRFGYRRGFGFREGPLANIDEFATLGERRKSM